MTRDRRLTPARPDLAADHLQGQVQAARFAPPKVQIVQHSVANLQQAPIPDAPLDTQALFGEEVWIYEQEEGWAWGQLKRDHYVGFLPDVSLGAKTCEPTHQVCVPLTFLYPAPNIKLPVEMSLPMGARVHCVSIEGDFARLDQLGFVWAAHLSPVDVFASDFVSVAEQFLGAPYLWGGRTIGGIDCSGLVQTALAAAGIFAPRDTDMQQAALGVELKGIAEQGELKRGDLIFWKGHVGIMRDAQTLLHANGHHMLVVSEPLQVAAARILAKTGADIASIRRL